MTGSADSNIAKTDTHSRLAETSTQPTGLAVSGQEFPIAASDVCVRIGYQQVTST
jgi:hypothetical protein